MNRELPAVKLPRELLIVGRSVGDAPRYAYVSVLEGTGRIFGKSLLSGVFSGDAHLSRAHFRVDFSDGRIFVTQMSTNNDTLLRDSTEAISSLKRGTQERREVGIGSLISAGKSLFKVEQILPSQLVSATADGVALASQIENGAVESDHEEPIDSPVPNGHGRLVGGQQAVDSPPVTVTRVRNPSEVEEGCFEQTSCESDHFSSNTAGHDHRGTVETGSADRTHGSVPRGGPKKLEVVESDSEGADSRRKQTESADTRPMDVVRELPEERVAAQDESAGMFDSGDFGPRIDNDENWV